MIDVRRSDGVAGERKIGKLDIVKFRLVWDYRNKQSQPRL